VFERPRKVTRIAHADAPGQARHRGTLT